MAISSGAQAIVGWPRDSRICAWASRSRHLSSSDGRNVGSAPVGPGARVLLLEEDIYGAYRVGATLTLIKSDQMFSAVRVMKRIGVVSSSVSSKPIRFSVRS